MKTALLIFASAAALAIFGAVVSWDSIVPPREVRVSPAGTPVVVPPPAAKQKTAEERTVEAHEKSRRIKGLYMTADVANDQGAAATRLRNHLIRLAEDTEINGLVIDVKEVCGADYNEKNLKKLLADLHEKNIWVIARMVVAKDASQIYVHPEWYLTRETPKAVSDQCAGRKHLRAGKPPIPAGVILWQDNKGGYWFDLASEDVRKYILGFSKKVIDLGFDELQYDYIRYPSDGDTQSIVYPVTGQRDSKCVVMESLFDFLGRELKSYKPEIILSADFFGYTAIGVDTGIGQCIAGIKGYFDYVSFMVYPSHYYSGLVLPEVPQLGLPAINMSKADARANPAVVVERSLRFAKDYFDGKIDGRGKFVIATTTAVAGGETKVILATTTPRSRVRSRPWIEDFFHDEDKAANRPWGVEKVRMQVDAAERVSPHGWMLWNPANIYTKEALLPEVRPEVMP